MGILYKVKPDLSVEVKLKQRNKEPYNLAWLMKNFKHVKEVRVVEQANNTAKLTAIVELAPSNQVLFSCEFVSFDVAKQFATRRAESYKCRCFVLDLNTALALQAATRKAKP